MTSFSRRVLSGDTGPSRRTVLAGLLASGSALAVVLAGCSSDTADSAGGAVTTDAGWSFTDDLGVTTTLDHSPTLFSGLNDVIVSLLNYGITPVASFGYSSLKADQRFDGLDVSGITQVGTSYGEIDLEKLAEARPDIIVANVYPTDAKGTIDKTAPDYGFKDMAQQKQLAQIAPIVTIYMGGDGGSVVRRTTALAVSLGAKASVVAAAKAKYDAASDALAKAATESRVTVTAFYADADGVSVAKPADDPALRLYRNVGVRMTVPTPKGFYWGTYSWENAGKIGGDVFLLEQSGYSVSELEKQETIADAPALEAGQVHPWTSAGMDYVAQAAYMNRLAGWLSASKVVTS